MECSFKFDSYRGASKLAGVYIFLKIICEGSEAFLKNFWGYEALLRIYHGLHIRPYSSTILPNQKSLKLMMKNPPTLWLLPSCR